MQKTKRHLLCVALIYGAVISAQATEKGKNPGTPRKYVHVTLNQDGQQANEYSILAFLSHDAQFVAFTSYSTNLVSSPLSKPTNNVYLKDLKSGKITLVSKSVSGGESNGNSYVDSISPDARFITYSSHATNLVAPIEGWNPGSWRQSPQIFMWDRKTNKTYLVSTGFDRLPANKHAQGSFILPGSRLLYEARGQNMTPRNTSSVGQVYLKKIGSTKNHVISSNNAGEASDQGGGFPVVSRNGRYVAFISPSTNLAPRPVMDQVWQVYRKDLKSGQLLLITQDAEGEPLKKSAMEPTISPNGNLIAYASNEGPYTECLLRDVARKKTISVSKLVAARGGPAYCRHPIFSPLGDKFYFMAEVPGSGVSSHYSQIYSFDLKTSNFEHLSNTQTGAANGRFMLPTSISGDGKWMAFFTDASNISSSDTNSRDDIYMIRLN